MSEQLYPRMDPAAGVAARRIPDARSDLDLVAAVLTGDASAFEAIMRRYNRLMFRTARGIVNDDADAQDVVQEAYLRAFASMQTYRGEAALSTWVARIAINGALSLQRKQSRLVQLDETEAPLDAEHLAEDPMAELPSDTSSPETPASQAQAREFLQRAIDQLPALYRSLFMLRAVQEMTVEETASALQVSPDVVKTRYLRVRSMLRNLLGADVGRVATELYAFAGGRCDAVVASVLAELRARGLIRPH
ncbi:RNA polymerase sigma factor [Aquabacterium sp. A7-Y]|uniref:RNA polymerase sigma factor n=1 Tax=Aquabacterium sp. A7-Y TaxID=1349605 RepID=UPI00223E0A61|nr:RNA polymerase sigma factor [Aquabacterium sp. A7-Y]MCW7540461.1 RNA polymerase sigma factor [Aquabacterium sp. A7-Y]